MTANTLDKRNYGIDILKLVSMFLVVMLHSYTKGVYPQYNADRINDDIGYFIESLAYCCVNCFALASGFLGVSTQSFKNRRIVNLWIQTVFYCLVITLFTQKFFPTLVGQAPFKIALTPISNKQYWYLTAYCGVFFFMPVFNAGLKDMTRKQALALIFGVICVYIGIEYYTAIDLYYLATGYSAIWLIVLYLIGGALYKLNAHEYVKHNFIWFIMYLACCIWAFCGKQHNEALSVAAGQFKADIIYLQYNSLPILLSSIFLVLFCTGIKVKNNVVKKVLKVLSPASFGVYLIHVHPYVFRMPFWNKFRELYSAAPVKMVMGALLGTVIIYVSCLAIDLIRIQLFKLLRINKIVDVTADAIASLPSKIIKKDSQEVQK